MRDSGASLDSIRERVDLVELVREYVPSLKKAGRTWKACCPFHDEKTPSFTVNQEKGLFYCFGCQAGGDIFGFLMKIEGLTFPEAGEKLAGRAGLEWRASGSLSGGEKERLDMRRALDFAKSFYHKELAGPPGRAALEYLHKRGIQPAFISAFELGWAPAESDAFIKAARKAGHADDILFRAGLMGRGEGRCWDYFRGRVLFPIKNHRGEMTGFGGRILGQGEPKYLNSPDTPLFSKSKTLFAIDKAGPHIRKAGCALVLEGYMDVIACHQFGQENAVAPLGTALGEEHARLLKRYCDGALLLFDPDAAGKKAALKAANTLVSAGMFVKAASLDGGLDPDEYLLKHGRAAFDAALEGAEDALAFHARLLREESGGPLRALAAQDKTRAADALMETVSRHPDKLVRVEWTKAVSDMLSLPSLDIEKALTGILARKQAEASPRAPRRHAPETAPVPEPEMPVEERDLVRFSLHAPQCCMAAAELSPEEFSSPRAFGLLREVMKLARSGAAADCLAATLARQSQPEEAALVTRLAAQPLPADFDGARDIETCVVRVRRQYLARRFAELKGEIKRVSAAGQDTAALLKEQCEIAVSLKSGRNP
ncbi:MAG: DNA primase [Elusimicrobiales bacterium]